LWAGMEMGREGRRMRSRVFDLDIPRLALRLRLGNRVEWCTHNMHFGNTHLDGRSMDHGAGVSLT
jgi:hypothetical protein